MFQTKQHQNVLFVMLANAMQIKEWFNSLVSSVCFWHSLKVMFMSLVMFPTAPPTHMTITQLVNAEDAICWKVIVHKYLRTHVTILWA